MDRFLVFPSDEETKLRLTTVCEKLGITLEEWFFHALIESEQDALLEDYVPKINRKMKVKGQETAE